MNITAEWVSRGLCIPLAFLFYIIPTILFLFCLSKKNNPTFNWYLQSCDLSFVFVVFLFLLFLLVYVNGTGIYFRFFCFHFICETTSKSWKLCIQNKLFFRVDARCSSESALIDTCIPQFSQRNYSFLLLFLIQTGINICMNIIATNLRPPISNIARAKAHKFILIRCLQFAHTFLIMTETLCCTQSASRLLLINNENFTLFAVS